MNKLLLPLLLIIFMSACNDEFQEQEENLDLATHSRRNKHSQKEYTAYHFIRFNVEKNKCNGNYARRIERIARCYKGVMLTDGRPGTCAEGFCRKINIVLAFPSVSDGNRFSSKFQRIFCKEIKRGFKDLSYIALNNFGFLGSPDIRDFQAFLMAEGDITNEPVFFNEYAPAAEATINNYGGYRLWPMENGYQDCLIGKCADFNAIVGFDSYQTLNEWYYSEEYQVLIPFRNTITANDGTILTRR